MSEQKLSYGEWRKRYSVSFSEEARKSLKEFHNLDIDEEIEWCMRKDYELYINLGTET